MKLPRELPSSCHEGSMVRVTNWEFPRFFTLRKGLVKLGLRQQPRSAPRAGSPLGQPLSLRGHGSAVLVVDLRTFGRAEPCVERYVWDTGHRVQSA